MNTTIKGSWKEQKEKLKQKFTNLTDDDLTFEDGKKDEMLESLQYKLGKKKGELYRIIALL